MFSLLLFVWFLGIVGLVIGVAARVTTLREVHHAYLGTLLVIGSVLIYVLGGAPWLAWTLLAVGAVLTLDDGIEHASAAAEGDPTAAWSPIHTYLVPLLYRLPGFKALEDLLDRLCGKPQPPQPGKGT